MSKPLFLQRKPFFQKALELLDEQPGLAFKLKQAITTGDFTEIKELIEGQLIGLEFDKRHRLETVPPESRMAITIEVRKKIDALKNLFQDAEQLERIVTKYLGEFEGEATYKAIVKLLQADRSGDLSHIFDVLEEAEIRRSLTGRMISSYLQGFDSQEALEQAFDEVKKAKETGDFSHIEDVLEARSVHDESMGKTTHEPKKIDFMDRVKNALENFPGGGRI